mgnify:FL=1
MIEENNNFTEQSAKEMGMSEDEHKIHLGLSQSKSEKLAELKRMKNTLFSVLPIVVITIFVMIWYALAQFNFVSSPSGFWLNTLNIIMPLFATYTLFIIGKPYILGVYRFARYGKANMDTLVGIGTGVAYI